VKVLLVILKFRELPQFREAVKDLKIDKLWIKWYGQITKPDAYSVAREEFLKRTEYTHLLLLTDDVIIQQKDIDQLIQDYEDTGCDVISGWFNNDLTTHADDTNFSYTLPPDPPSNGSYEGYHFEKIKKVEQWQSVIPGAWRLEVLHQGTALSLISRKIIEEVPFRNSQGCCIDSCLSLDLAEKGIKQYVDLRVRTLHLKINEQMAWRISEVLQHLPEVVFEPVAI
jgi:hypothetical protein